MSLHPATMVTLASSVILQEVLEYAADESNDSNDFVFCEIYHSLIHSHSLETLLSLEQTYAIEIQKVLDQRDTNITVIENRYLCVRSSEKCVA